MYSFNRGTIGCPDQLHHCTVRCQHHFLPPNPAAHCECSWEDHWCLSTLPSRHLPHPPSHQDCSWPYQPISLSLQHAAVGEETAESLRQKPLQGSPSYNFDCPQNKPMIPIASMFNKWLLCPEEVKGRYFNVTNWTPNKATFFFTSDPFGVIEDVLDCERCEHHTYGFSWHTHLGTVWERPSIFFFRKHTSNLHMSTFALRMIGLWTNLT